VALAAILGTMVARAPLQPSDNLKFIGQAIHGSPLDVMRRHGQGKYRPAGLLAARAVTRVFNGHEAGAFRWLLGLQVAATGVLFGMALQVGTWYEVAAGTLALIVLFGHHAFRPTTLEGYPINHFGVVALCCLLALVLIQRPAAGWRSVAALAIALVAMFTLESGVLVVGVVGTGYLLGYRGVGLRGVALVLIALGVYLAARWWVLPADLRVPAFAGDRSGYGFAVLESDDIRMHFAGGAARIWWRVHNVAAAFLSVLFAEPREGQWSFVDAITRRRVTLAPAVEVLSSVSTTALVTTTMLAARRRRAADGEGPAAWRLCMLAVSIILASAILCLNYIKDDILSTAAVFYALATYATARSALTWFAARRRMLGIGALTAVLAGLGVLWCLRVSDLACEIRYRAFVKRNRWAAVDLTAPEYASDDRALGERMRRAYITLDVPPPGLVTHIAPCLMREP
jgi:hypothetical protein